MPQNYLVATNDEKLKEENEKKFVKYLINKLHVALFDAEMLISEEKKVKFIHFLPHFIRYEKIINRNAITLNNVGMFGEIECAKKQVEDCIDILCDFYEKFFENQKECVYSDFSFLDSDITNILKKKLKSINGKTTKLNGKELKQIQILFKYLMKVFDQLTINNEMQTDKDEIISCLYRSIKSLQDIKHVRLPHVWGVDHLIDDIEKRVETTIKTIEDKKTKHEEIYDIINTLISKIIYVDKHEISKEEIRDFLKNCSICEIFEFREALVNFNSFLYSVYSFSCPERAVFFAIQRNIQNIFRFLKRELPSRYLTFVKPIDFSCDECFMSLGYVKNQQVIDTLVIIKNITDSLGGNSFKTIDELKKYFSLLEKAYETLSIA